MPEEMKAAWGADLPFIGLCCPKCGYNLTGTTETRCPECGEAFDPAKLRPPKSGWRSGSWWRSRASWRVTLAAVLLAVYLPNTWVFWIDYGWRGGYRMGWVKMFPALPSLVLAVWGRAMAGFNNAFGDDWFLVSGVVTAVMIAICVLIGRRSRRWLLAVCVVMFVLQIFNALGSYALFRM